MGLVRFLFLKFLWFVIEGNSYKWHSAKNTCNLSYVLTVIPSFPGMK